MTSGEATAFTALINQHLGSQICHSGNAFEPESNFYRVTKSNTWIPNVVIPVMLLSRNPAFYRVTKSNTWIPDTSTQEWRAVKQQPVEQHLDSWYKHSGMTSGEATSLRV